MRRLITRGIAPVEVLLGVTIVSLVLIVLYSGYRLGVRSWESGEDTHAAVSDLRLAGSVIRRYLPQAVPLVVANSSSWQLWFQGEARRLVFVTTIPVHLGAGGTHEMTLQVDGQENAAALTLSRRLLHPDSEPGSAAIDAPPRILIRELESAAFAYFGAAGADGVESWHASWTSEQQLPRLVRLRLVSQRVGAWPDMVIRLPTDDSGLQPTAPIPAPLPGQ
jgi:general secretion pathway protein J